MNPAGGMRAPDGAPTLRQVLVEDLATYAFDLTEAGLWVTAAHRVRTWSERSLPAPLRSPVRVATAMVKGVADWLFGIRLPAEVELGRRVRIWHHGCIRLAARAIGDDVHIRPNTTFGPARGAPDEPRQWPIIGAEADIGAGTTILGALRVGTRAFVGANSLVLADVPDETVALGVPARLLPHRASTERKP
jgi:serine O-acetyltransferase